MRKHNGKLTDKTTQKPSAASIAKEGYCQPDPPEKYRFSYKVDIIRRNQSFLVEFFFPLPIGGYYLNHHDPIKARAIAFKRAAEVPYDAKLSLYGALYAKVYFVDELQQECRLIHDMAAKPTVEVCENLEYEYELLNRLGYDITDWQLITAPDGNPYHAILSEFKITDICSDQCEPVHNTEAAQSGLSLTDEIINNKNL